MFTKPLNVKPLPRLFFKHNITKYTNKYFYTFHYKKKYYLQKPYACTVNGCNKRYTDPSSLRKHVKNHAPQISAVSQTLIFTYPSV